MPAPIINMASKEKVTKMVENYFCRFTSRRYTLDYPLPTMHTTIPSGKHGLRWSLSQHTGNEGDFGIIIYLNLLQFFQPLAEVRNLPESLNDSSTIFKDTAQKRSQPKGWLLFALCSEAFT